MKKVKRVLAALLACALVGAGAVGMTGCDIEGLLENGVNINVGVNSSGEDVSSDDHSVEDDSMTDEVSNEEDRVSSAETSSGDENGSGSDSENDSAEDEFVFIEGMPFGRMPSEGLLFTQTQNAGVPTAYGVMGMGTCVDTDVVIPSLTYDEEKPVTEVEFWGEKMIAYALEKGIMTEEFLEENNELIEEMLVDIKIERIWIPSSAGCFHALFLDTLEELVIEKFVKVDADDSLYFLLQVFGCPNLKSIYYTGTAEDWAQVEIEKLEETDLAETTVYYYSEDMPTEEGDYWHYVNGEPTAW